MAAAAVSGSPTPKLSYNQASPALSLSRTNFPFLSHSLSSLTLTARKHPALSFTVKSTETEAPFSVIEPEIESSVPETEVAVETEEPKRDEVFAVVMTKYPQGRRHNGGVSSLKMPSLSGQIGLRQSTGGKRSKFYHLAAGGDNITTEISDKDSKSVDNSSDNLPGVNSAKSSKIEESNGNQKSSSNVKRASLTARERLRAARVLNRYTESKPPKPVLGSRLLDALQQSDKGKKRPGLPQAPSNMLDDSKRGMPKEGWTIELTSGMDVFYVILSFVLISTIMFATTFLVWKLGAIHFNEN